MYIINNIINKYIYSFSIKNEYIFIQDKTGPPVTRVTRQDPGNRIPLPHRHRETFKARSSGNRTDPPFFIATRFFRDRLKEGFRPGRVAFSKGGETKI